jgi:sugar/nucleoside kinase (ribokinase family)
MQYELITVGCVCADVIVRPVDRYPERGHLELVPDLEIHLGGLAAVTAAVFAQLGGKSALIGKLGSDGFGDYVIGVLNNAGVDTGHLRRMESEHTSATIVLVTSGGERTFLHHLGTNGTTRPEDIDLDLVKQAKAIHWGGPGVTPGLTGEGMGKVFKELRETGVMTCMDTCFDGSGTWFPLIEAALPHLDVVMSSLEEARHYTGKQEPEDIVAFFRSFGVENVMLKLGGDGMIVENSRETHHLKAHNVQPVDTTGAGDAACGGFIYGLLNGWGLERSGRLANAVGGLTVQHMGGAEAITSLEDTLAFMDSGS